MGNENERMPSLSDVQEFLRTLHQKMEFQDVQFEHRPEYIGAYAELRDRGYGTRELTQIIKELTPENYSEGPIKESPTPRPQGDLWVFGKFIKHINPKRNIKEIEYYIKVQIGCPNQVVICISFHPSKKPMGYPSLL